MTANPYEGPTIPEPTDEDQTSSLTSSSNTRHNGVPKSTKSTKSGTVPRLFAAEELRPGSPTSWLARNLLARGAVAVLVGEEGIGKSLWWVLVVAHVTTGAPSKLLGIPARAPGDVVLVLTEDSWADVRPRLELAGADLSHIYVFCADDDGSGSPLFPRDFVLIDEAIGQRRPALVVLDAWLDTVSGGLQVKDPQRAREALHPWKERATRWGSSVLLLTHTNRLDTDDLRAMIGATSTLRQKARVLLFAVRPPDRDGELYVGPDKSNHAGRASAVAYRIEAVQVRQPTDDDPGTVPRLRITGDALLTIREQYMEWRRQARDANKPPTADQLAEAWITDYLAQHGGEAPAEDVKAAARAEGINVERLAPAVKRRGGYVGPSGGPGTPFVYRRLTSQTSQTSQPVSDGATTTKSATKSGDGHQ